MSTVALTAGLIVLSTIGCGSSDDRSTIDESAGTGRHAVTTSAASASVPATTAPSHTGNPTGVPTQPPDVDCGAVDGSVDLPGVPALVRSPATDHRRAAVVMLHGFTATPEAEETVSGWTSFLHGTDVVVVYPRGNPTSTSGYGWTTGTDRYTTTGTDDVGRITGIVAWLVDQACVDPNQVLIAGESNGAAMALLVACSGRLTTPARLYALAIPAVDEHVTATCTDAEPVPTVVFAGRLDATVPYEGRPGDPDAPLAPKDWFTSLAPDLQGCSSRSPSTRSVPGGTLLTYPDCARTTVFFTIDDGRHTWPGGPTGAGGLDPGDFPASAIAWCASGLTATPPPTTDCAEVLDTYVLPVDDGN